MLTPQTKDRAGEKRMGRIPAADAEQLIRDADANGYAGYFEADLVADNYRHATVWCVRNEMLGIAFFTGWKCGRIAST